ncbi:MAG TPA: RusA family crossover junction endodeoxyribonuclease [Burkholderiaceae bacterium]|nr:RusA family crossover junction endodeoxyribonuclease [Burkholderiaceae bacterium]
MGQPVGKARPRVTRAGRVYTPKKTEQAEQDIRKMATYVMCGEPPLQGPLELGVTFTMDVPPSWTKTKRQQAYSQQIKPAAKPDIDNLIKTVMDACNGVTYADDAQVVRITASKRYRTECEAPMTTVRVIPI